MKKAFSMIELIMVIVVVGVIYGAAVMSMPDGKFYSDVNFITQKIKEKQLQAIGYDTFDFSSRGGWDDLVCINIVKDTMNLNERNSNAQKKYQIDSQTTIDVTTGWEKICFDRLGRPYKDDFQLNNLLKMSIELNITNKDRTKQLLIMPVSGYIIGKE